MSIRVAINGFGRMGKLALRAGLDNNELEFVHINEIAGDAHCHAHLIQFDTVFESIISTHCIQRKISFPRIFFTTGIA